MIDTKLIRQKILDLAIRGKLVPQDPSDEPASELLKRIRAKKAALVKSGKIKKEKPLPPISKDEIPFPIPASWQWVRLGQLFSVVSARRVHKADWKSSGIPFYRAREIAKLAVFGFVDNELFISQEQYEEYKQSSGVPNPGDIMVTAVGTIGKAYVVQNNDLFYYKDASVICLENHHKMNSLFFKYCFSTSFIVSQIFSKSTGTTVDTITIEKAEQYVFPLPPLAEQERIVAKVEALMNEVDTIERETENLNKTFSLTREKVLDLAIRGKLVPQDPTDEPASELLKRIHAEKAALIKSGKLKKEKTLPPISKDEIPFDIPASWEWIRLGNICSYGICKSLQSSSIPDDAWVLDLEDIEKDSGRLLCRMLNTERRSTSSKHVFQKGNVLYSKLRTYLNKVLVADRDGYCTSEILPLDFRGHVLPEYARRVLMSQMFLDYTARCGYGVKMPRLGTEDGRMALFPLPPLAEQKRIVSKLESILSTLDVQQKTCCATVSAPFSRQEKHTENGRIVGADHLPD